MFILFLLISANSSDPIQDTNSISSTEASLLPTCSQDTSSQPYSNLSSFTQPLNESHPNFSISSDPTDSLSLHSLFQDYFFGNPEQNITRNFPKAFHFLSLSLKQNYSESIFAYQVIQQWSDLDPSFSNYLPKNFSLPCAETILKSTTKKFDILAIFHLASLLNCVNLRKIDHTEFFDGKENSFKFDSGHFCEVNKDKAGAALLQSHVAKRYIDKSGIAKKIISVENLMADDEFGREHEKYLILKKKAFKKKEHLEEILKIGQIFYFGSIHLGIEADYKQAMEFYKLALKFGSKKAAVRIGKMYLHGNGVTKNVTKAIIFLEKAERQDSLEAIKTLTVIYEQGKVVEKNYSRAIELAQKGVDLGDTQSFNNLGVYYMNGMGTTQNSQEGVKYMAMAAVMGSPAAMYNMASQYYYGKVIQKDYLQSFNLSMLAIHSAQQDDYINKAYSRFKQGDFTGAYFYYLFAASLGYIDAYKGISYMIIKKLIKPECKFEPDYCLKHFLVLGLSRRDNWSMVQLAKVLMKDNNELAITVLENAALSEEKLFNLAYAYQVGIGCQVNLTKAEEGYERLVSLAQGGVLEYHSMYPAWIALWALRIKIKVVWALEVVAGIWSN